MIAELVQNDRLCAMRELTRHLDSTSRTGDYIFTAEAIPVVPTSGKAWEREIASMFEAGLVLIADEADVEQTAVRITSSVAELAPRHFPSVGDIILTKRGYEHWRNI